MRRLLFTGLLSLCLTACAASVSALNLPPVPASATPPALHTPQPPLPTPLSSLTPTFIPAPTVTFVLPTATEVIYSSPTPPALGVGQYLAQPGDTVDSLAVRFRTGAWYILDRNPGLMRGPLLAPGLLLNMPTDELSVNVFTEHLLPDSELIYSPSVANFSVRNFVLAHPGWLATYAETPEDPTVPSSGWAMVEFQAQQFSINPRLLLALLEYQSGALSNPAPAVRTQQYALGMDLPTLAPGLEHQLGWAGNMLDMGYYGWRRGARPQVNFSDGSFRFVDGRLNAGTFGLLYLLAQMYDRPGFDRGLAPGGLLATYRQLFGDPWAYAIDPILLGGLAQPELQLPFEPGVKWQYTGGPHSGWGYTIPYSAIDFAPPANDPGCVASSVWAVAVHAGVVTRSETGVVELDLGDGWSVVYLHIGTPDRVALGARLNAGDRVGHPSCEGGHASAVHVHLARKYQGEWIPADGPLPLVLSGWTAHFGEQRYQGSLSKGDKTIEACACGGAGTLVWIEP